MNLTFVMDESGSKGYSDQKEQAPGELGVVAGFFVPTEYAATLEQELDRICAKYNPAGKLHITDLKPNEQSNLRQEIFDLLLARNAYVTYDAIYVEGFNAYDVLTKDMSKSIRQNLRNGLKYSSNKQYELLHAELFSGAFDHALSFGQQYCGNSFELQVVTDQVDPAVTKEFNKKAERLLTAGKASQLKTTAFDPKTKQVLHGSVVSEVIEGKEFFPDVSGISYTITTSDSSLVVAADVVANSIHHHLLGLQASDVGRPLNTESAMDSHPLQPIIYGNNADSLGAIQASDTLFMHPSRVTVAK